MSDSSPAKKQPHECEIEAQLAAKLAENNTRLVHVWSFSGGTWPSIQTELIEKKRGQRPMLAIPSFCPWCGEPI